MTRTQFLFLYCVFVSMAPEFCSAQLRWPSVAFAPPGTSGTTQTDAIQTRPTSANEVVSIVPGTPVVPIVPGGSSAPASAPGSATPPAVGAGVSPVGEDMSKAAGVLAPPATREPAPKTPLATGCHATLATTRASIPGSGGSAEMRAVFDPPGCGSHPELKAGWLHGDSSQPGVYKVSVDPNPTAAIREAFLVFGDKQFIIAQAGGTRAAKLAASPGRLEFNVKPKKTQKLVLAVWSDEPPGAYVASAKAPGQWLDVRELPSDGNNTFHRRRFEVSVQSGSLRSGRYEAVVQIRPSDATTQALQIPVVVNIRHK